MADILPLGGGVKQIKIRFIKLKLDGQSEGVCYTNIIHVTKWTLKGLLIVNVENETNC